MLSYFDNICSLVCTLLQLFSKHAIKAKSISFQIKKFLCTQQTIQFSNLPIYLHSLIIITSNAKCDCGFHHIFCPKLVRSLFGQIVRRAWIRSYFSGAHLSGAHLSGDHLSGVHLTGDHLFWCSFVLVPICSGAHLFWCSFVQCSLV